MKTTGDARKISIPFIYWRVKTTETKYKRVKITALLNKHNQNIPLFIFPETTNAFCKEVEDDWICRWCLQKESQLKEYLSMLHFNTI